MYLKSISHTAISSDPHTGHFIVRVSGSGCSACVGWFLNRGGLCFTIFVSSSVSLHVLISIGTNLQYRISSRICRTGCLIYISCTEKGVYKGCIDIIAIRVVVQSGYNQRLCHIEYICGQIPIQQHFENHRSGRPLHHP